MLYSSGYMALTSILKIGLGMDKMTDNLKNPNEEDPVLTIAGLRKEIEDLESKVIKCVPVSERFPEKQGFYLVYDPSNYGVETDFWEIPSHGIPPRFSHLGKTVTHWSRRPPGPEEEK